MRTQSGPYRASETIDTSDVLHIGGVLYAGEPRYLLACRLLADPSFSCVGYCGDCHCYASSMPADIFIDYRCPGSIHPRSPPPPGGVRQGTGRDRQKDGKRAIGRLRRSGLTSLLRVRFEGGPSVSTSSPLFFCPGYPCPVFPFSDIEP